MHSCQDNHGGGDLLRKFSASNKPTERIHVKDVMSWPVITIKAFDFVEAAAAAMTQKRVKRLVVIEQDGSLLGVL
jgi:CBS domain-containing protein